MIELHRSWGGYRRPFDCRAATENGALFLIENQGEDGEWRDFRLAGSDSNEWVTAYVGLALHQSSIIVGPKVARAAQKAAQFLKSREGTRGGWGFSEAAPIDCDSTAWGITMLAAVDKVPEEPYRSLRRFQRTGGGYSCYDGFSHPSMSASGQADVSAIVLKALLTASEQDRDAMLACATYLKSQQERDGLWPSFWYQRRLYVSAHALEALGFFDSSYLKWLESSVILDSAMKELPSSDPFSISYAIEIATHLNDKVVADDLIRELLSLQRSDGRWTAGEPFMLPDPWNYPDKEDGAAVSDHNALFTTATALRAISCRFRTFNETVS